MSSPRTKPGSRINQPEWRPNIEFFQSLSKDGRYVISQTVITSIKPRRYLETILGLHTPGPQDPVPQPHKRSVDHDDRGN